MSYARVYNLYMARKKAAPHSQVLLLLPTQLLRQVDDLAQARGEPRMVLLREAVRDMVAKHFGAMNVERRQSAKPAA